MAPLYELTVLGLPKDRQLEQLREKLSEAVNRFGLHIGREVSWTVLPPSFEHEQRAAAAAIFFGGVGAPTTNLDELRRLGIPILPVVSALSLVATEIPVELQPLNCLVWDETCVERTATALLECVGLLPRQRRVFLSYKRSEAREAALQLFDELSARMFDVFLDTHGIAPGEEFQINLWHRLCEADVLIMLDTNSYFESRWTTAEFGRALAKNISVLRIGWPDSTPSVRTATASRAELVTEEIDTSSGRIAQSAIDRICAQLEIVRSESIAVRTVNMVSRIRLAVQQLGGSIAGVGGERALQVKLPDGRLIEVRAMVGVPTSASLEDASSFNKANSAAVVFDTVGIHPNWLRHLEWLGQHVRVARFVKAHEVAWEFSDWN